MTTKKIESQLVELVGNQNLFTLFARGVRLRACQILSNSGDSFEFDVIQEMVKLSEDLSELLGQNSALALYFRESVAYQYQQMGQIVNSEKAFQKIYEATKNAPEPGRRYAAWAQLERSMVLLKADPAAARDCFRFFENYQKQFEDLIPPNHIDRSNIPFYRLFIEFSNGDYERCIESGREALQVLSKGNSPIHLVREAKTNAYLASANAYLASETSDLQQKRKFEEEFERLKTKTLNNLNRISRAWQTVAEVKAVLADGFAEQQNWDEALELIDQAIATLEDGHSKISGQSSSDDTVAIYTISKIDYANRAAKTELASETAEQLVQLLDGLDPGLYESNANRVLAVAFKNDGQNDRARQLVDRSIQLLERAKSIDFPNSKKWKDDLEWFRRFRNDLETQ